MKIKITSERELLNMASELWHTLVNVRYHSRKWEEEHGSALLAAKKKWERKADDLIIKYNVAKSHQATDIKIEINNPE